MSPRVQDRWKTLDKDLDRFGMLELGARNVSRRLMPIGAALVFLVLVGVGAALHSGAASSGVLLVAAALFSGYLALAIGANDVANNMGPVVGARALTMGGALVIAALAESAGALLAGWDVVDTIANGILLPDTFTGDRPLILAMLSALIATAIWLNIATWSGLAVSTTHSVVGGVMGAGIAAGGFATVNWPMMGQITLSWLLAPVMGGAIAAALLAFLKSRVLYAEDRITAARRWVPVMIGVMCGAFTAYLAGKGLEQVTEIAPFTAVALGIGGGMLGLFIAQPLVRRWSEGLDNRRRSLKHLFKLPLILAGAALSFAHGANDVSNAVGPLVAIAQALAHDAGAGLGVEGLQVPLWAMCVGAGGLSFGLLLFGPRLIQLVGSEITKLNPMRGFCVALSTAITVILASWVGLPVSSTHIAVGSVFGVGFYREWFTERRARRPVTKQAPPELRQRRRLVRRSHVVSLSLAWMVTVPLTAISSAVVFVALHRLLP